MTATAVTTSRTISHTEVSAALDCQVRHAFSYTGRLTDGDALRPKSTAARLREGRAWGRAVAAWHEHSGEIDAVDRARAALEIVLSLDAAEQQQQGVFDQAEYDRVRDLMHDALTDYVGHAEPLILTRPEHEIDIPIPSRTGQRSSSRYHLACFLDGVHTDPEGRDWIVEFKFRGQLQSFEQIALSRQTRWYAWAWRQQTGRPIAGVIVDERLAAVPAQVRFNKDGSLSKVQSCRPDRYLIQCSEHGREPVEEVVAKLESKRWEARHVLLVSDRELTEAGWQLASAANLIRQLDAGRLYPVRNPAPNRCPSCAYREICGDPHDTALVDALFERKPPKRERQETHHAVAVR